VAEQIHASMQSVKAPSRKPVVDRVETEPGGEQLPTCDDPVLPPSQPGDRSLPARRIAEFTVHRTANPSNLVVASPQRSNRSRCHSGSRNRRAELGHPVDLEQVRSELLLGQAGGDRDQLA